MGVLLNSKFSNYSFRFPTNWFFPAVREKYESFFKNSTMPFKTLENYMSFTVQSISWPELSTELVEQPFKQVTKTFKGGWQGERYFNRSFDIVFKTTSGFLSYFIMQDQFLEYWRLFNPDEEVFLDDLTLRILNMSGYQVISVQFHDIVLSSISSLSLSFSSNVPEFQTFSATFNYKILEFKKEYQ